MLLVGKHMIMPVAAIAYYIEETFTDDDHIQNWLVSWVDFLRQLFDAIASMDLQPLVLLF